MGLYIGDVDEYAGLIGPPASVEVLLYELAGLAPSPSPIFSGFVDEDNCVDVEGSPSKVDGLDVDGCPLPKFSEDVCKLRGLLLFAWLLPRRA